MKAFIGISSDNSIVVHIGESKAEFSLSQAGCRRVAEFLAWRGIFDWSYSSSIDHTDEYADVFDRNVGDAIEEELARI